MNMFNEENVSIKYRDPEEIASVTRGFMSKVFSWMFLAMAITAVTSFLWAGSPSLMSVLVKPEGGLSVLGWIVMFAPLGFVLLMSFGYQKLSAPLMTLLFIVYAVLMGMSFSFIFFAFSLGTIGITFAVTAGMFGVMALAGYFTKTDLTKFGSILMMGVIGIVIAMIVNFFLKSSMMGYVISVIGVLIFTGLTAYDVQKLKRIGMGIGVEQTDVRKMAIMGALTLYLDFINLFLFLLRLFGSRE
ncbi:MAG TPA: Bax inhibitor-1/YccA family protein [Bacteroidales bacterium]|jgi:FtsH-binding integral membrane protein|nr:Bax inhibitor-1/YccA family protein [Bacteroidales bacterium]HNZ43420.1 Bax inhibitor-1/YccA family protein [Bacteroidales bacterium]HOH83198.1 Bax inhibitor-1/YccA family protein [Bacteroidales bacterium]HPB25763.1 Bax inhibitor-1/YccA family protein [Bacteroidales bacterium]HPI31156.1 Bax inhibitor-1/YccA family protein [Bacteroidales bacterium]